MKLLINYIRFISVYFFSLLFSLTAFSNVDVSIHIENPIDENEPNELRYYLHSIVSGSVNVEEEAKSALQDLGRFESINCELTKKDTTSRLHCNLKRFRILQNIRFSGLPLLILEKELRKRIALKTGDLIKASDPKYLELIKRAEAAIISYIEKQGFFHSKVQTTYEEQNSSPSTDIIFKVEGGSYVKVKDVVLKSNLKTISTLDPELILRPFRQMCSNVRHSFEGIFQGTKACYNKDIEEELITAAEEKLANLGYVEAHVAVKRYFVERKDGPPNEVNLEVVARLGPRIVINFEFKDAQVLDPGFLASFLRGISGIEFFSRAFNLPFAGAEFPEDQTIIVDDLRNSLTFKSQQTFDDTQISESILAIKESLRTRGYLHAEVTASKDSLDKSYAKITFKIDPKDPTFVTDVKVVGSEIDSDTINQNVQFKVLPRALFSTGHFSLADLATDTESLRNFLLSQGYVESKVDSLIQEGANGITIVHQVVPGEKKLITQFKFTGDDKELTREFLKNHKICNYETVDLENEESLIQCQPFPFQKDQIENLRLQFFDLYRKNGFLLTEPTSTINDTNNNIVVHFYFPNTSERAKVEELLINGNLKTFSSVIQRELGSKFIEHGSNYLPYKLDEGLGRLRSYGVLSRATLEPILKTDSKNKYYLYLNLSEKPTFSGDIPFSFDSDFYFGLGFYMQERNLFGALLQLKTETDFGLFIGRRSGFRNTLTWPRVFGSPMKISFRVPELLYEILATEKIPKRHAQLKTAVDIQWEFLKILYPKLEFQFRIDKWQIADANSDFTSFSFFHDPIKAITSLDGLLDVLAQDSSLRAVLIPSITALSIDNFLDPKFGYKVTAAFQLSGKVFGNSIGFDVLDLRGTGYYTLGPITFAANFQLQRGFIIDPINNWWVLKYESDFETLGGARGPRAYQKGQIGIYEPPIDNSGTPAAPGTKADYHPGNLLLASALELRFPIAEKFLFARLDGAAFAEIGFVGACTNDFFCFDRIGQNNEAGENRQLGSTLGFGLRFMLPIGPFAIDYGFSPEHSVSRFNFQFGYPF